VEFASHQGTFCTAARAGWAANLRVGDIHGRADLLERLFSRIDEDLKDHPIAETMHIFLGDYIDRGRDSAAVLDLLIERAKAHRMVCLKGNHEIYLSEFLENPGILGAWAQYGALRRSPLTD